MSSLMLSLAVRNIILSPPEQIKEQSLLLISLILFIFVKKCQCTHVFLVNALKLKDLRKDLVNSPPSAKEFTSG